MRGSVCIVFLVVACVGHPPPDVGETGVDAAHVDDASDAGPMECRAGRSRCDGVCVLLEEDRDHCGACGESCPGDFDCLQSQCVPRLVVDETPARGRFSSLVIDDAGIPHIAYLDESDAAELAVRYATLGEFGWETQEVDRGAVGIWTTLELDARGAPVLAYYDQLDDQLRVATRSGNGWEVDVVAVGGRFSDILALPDGLQVIHYDYSVEDLFISTRSGDGRWSTEEIASEGDVGMYGSLGIDPWGTRWVSYHHVDEPGLHIAHDLDGAWVSEVVAGAGTTAEHTSLVIDAEGLPHVAYYDAETTSLHYAWLRPEGWHVRVVDDEGDVGAFASLALSEDGLPVIAYYDETNADLKLAVGDDDGTFYVETIEAPGQVGRYASLALHGGTAHIAYYSDSERNLRYRRMPLP